MGSNAKSEALVDNPGPSLVKSGIRNLEGRSPITGKAIRQPLVLIRQPQPRSHDERPCAVSPGGGHPLCLRAATDLMVPRRDRWLLSEKLKPCFQSLYLFVTFTVYSHRLQDQCVTISKGDVGSGAGRSSETRLPCQAAAPGNTPQGAFLLLTHFTSQTTETDSSQVGHHWGQCREVQETG